VVELRIFEGEDAKHDITFSYNANFFLFATLEAARAIHPGRVQAPPQQIPVLTGMPVSGMAYLDRPSEAGYFIFPDLSVRHEGKYRLSFNLYEETKDKNDRDANEPENDQKVTPPAGGQNSGSFDWRLEVKSAAFTVYSAKKFPGLAESTILSRTVAEQGCRVRIRRDVRMRRRDGKAGGEFGDDYEEEYIRSRRTGSPESVRNYERQRSLSNASVDRQPYQPDHRRQSGEYPIQSYGPSYNPSPATPQSANTNYLTFGNSSQQYQTPQFAQPQPPPMQGPPPQQYGARPNGTQGAYQQPPPYGYPSERQQAYGQYQGQAPRENYENGDYRRSSASYPPPAQPVQGAQYPPASNDPPNYNRSQPAPSYQYPPRSHTPNIQQPVSLAPLKMPPLEPKYESLSSPAVPLSASNRMGAPLPSPGYPERSNSYGSTFAPPPPPPPPNIAGAKRTYDSVFNNTTSGPLYNHARPQSRHHSIATAYDDDDADWNGEAFKMSYKRADGTPHSRELPALQ
jgi:hypothetical protein